MKREKFSPAGLLALNPSAFGLEFLIGGIPDRVNEARGEAAIVQITGPLEHQVGMFDSYDAIKARVSQALASNAKAVVLSIDSPGGVVSGVYETSNEMRAMAAAARKPLYSYVSGQASSAAYALACAGERIFVPSGALVGSIGVIAMTVDTTKADAAMGLRFQAVTSGERKGDGSPHMPVTEGVIAAIQTTVDAQADVFFELVAKSRGVSAAAVRGFQAGMFVGQQAINVGLADELTTLDELVARIGSGTVASAASAEERTTMAEDKKDEKKDMTTEEIRKALGAKAAGDGDEAKKCRAALAALDQGEEKKDDDKKDDDAKAKAEADEKDAKAKAEAEESAKALAATAATSNVISLASRIQTLEAERATERESKERAELLSSRPDLVPEVRKVFESAPIAELRRVMKELPKGPISAVHPAAAAQSSVQPTVGVGQGNLYASNPVGLTDVEKLKIKMGLGSDPAKAITFDGVTHTFGALTKGDARAFEASRNK